MLEKQFRLPATTRLRQAKSFNTTLFFLKVSNNSLPINRFGFVVRKSVDKRATVRNRIRRLFRSCVEDMLTELVTGHDLLFLLKGQILVMKKDDLYNEVRSFFKQQQLLA
jgi:ribonuclease P protein component